ncbi:MAG TPA: nucleoside diphosphate kinase regulator [Terriglobales bacterium]|nr:nucleoside diphosphate kinase regulator [Terriglobales bacterium]
MEDKNIAITHADYIRLQRLVESSRQFRHRDAKHLDDLEQELERAAIMKPGEVPSDVVTMNSRVKVKDLNSGRVTTYQIVFPGEADIAKNRISVLAPIGTGLLGYRAGTTLEWQVPSGMRRFRILEVEYQPEAAGVAA